MENELVKAMADLDEEQVLALVKIQLANGVAPAQILENCRQGMTIIGERYESGEYFLSDLIMAGEIFKQAGETLTPLIGASGGPAKGKVVIGTVQGDIHDIGKDIVVTMLRGANYEVYDLGVDVPVDKFLNTLKESGAGILGLSGLLTISFDPMRETVTAIQAAGLRDKVKVMIGGGPVTEAVRQYVGADALGKDAQSAVALCDGWTS